MKLIIVAAGQGTRLRPLTDHQPKCMVPFRGKPIIDHILNTANQCGIKEIAVVHGYRSDVLQRHLEGRGISFFHNSRFDQTNMVASLFCARPFLAGDLVISYGDIVYAPRILQALMEEPSDLALTIDRQWQKLWQWRMEDPLADAETLKLDEHGFICELGKRPKSLADIQAQYMGLIKWRAPAVRAIIQFYDSLDRGGRYDGKDFDNMYMTSFLQRIIDQLMPAKAVSIEGGWVEIDSISDLEAYTQHAQDLSL